MNSTRTHVKVPSRAAALAAAAALLTTATAAHAQVQTFNAATPADNATARANWLAAVGIVSPAFLADFESGFTNGQNIDDATGLFPNGLVIRDTGTANQVIIRSGSGVIGGSNPVGTFSATHNEQPSLVLDFSAAPVDYVGFLEIDQAGTSGLITFVGGGTASFSLDSTGTGGNIEEFFGIWRNDQPQIVSVALNASGDGSWGVDNIEYGPASNAAVAPEPATVALLASGLLVMAGAAVRRRKA